MSLPGRSCNSQCLLCHGFFFLGLSKWNIQIEAIPLSWVPEWKWHWTEPWPSHCGAWWARSKLCGCRLKLSSLLLLQHKLTHPGWSKKIICISKNAPCLCVSLISLHLCFYSRGWFVPRRQCLETFFGSHILGVLLTPDGYSPGMLLYILQCTNSPSQQRIIQPKCQ